MKYRLKVGFLAVFMLLALALSSPHYFPALICSVTLHELGHIIVARLRGIRLSEMKLGIFGASITPCDQLFSYADEILLCLGGPVMNFLSVAICISTGIGKSTLFIMSSLALGILNMLPIKGFDGGRILYAFLLILISPRTARALSNVISFIFIFTLWCFSVYLLLRRAATLTLFVFSASVFAKMFISDETG